MEYSQIASLGRKLRENIAQVIIGSEETVRIFIAAVIAGGHILMEDVPGTGKTLLCRTFASTLDAQFSRVQFTPDLLPSDITGISVYRQDAGEFRFVPGPVFTNLLLADEINRAVPRTQSALLECMEEHSVTENGVTRRLSDFFTVVATQNPVENRGTFPLPEAQMDRFMVRLRMQKPDHRASMDILERFLHDAPLEKVQKTADAESLLQARSLLDRCAFSGDCLDYLVRITERTHDPEKVLLGVSARGMLALAKLCRAFAALDGRDYVIPDDVKYLAPAALAHRIVMRGMEDAEAFVRTILDSEWAPTEK